jgi:hypothetical protein
MRLRYSLHKISTKENNPFNAAEYSWFKFGDILYAEKFAAELFSGFIEEHADLILSQTDIVILPSPYLSIPTASNFLCSFFKIKLNEFLFQNNRKACSESKIYRNQTYTEDYGGMNFEQRIKLISNDTYYIDKNFIDGKYCIFLDDIKITGSHEVIINRILDQHSRKNNCMFIYYAELSNTSIHPNIENYYNYFAIKSNKEIIEIMNRTTFRFNTRIIKYTLNAEEKDFINIVENFNQFKLSELFQLAISNNYHQIEEYKNNIEVLNQKLCQSIYKKGNVKPSMPQNSLLV